jgi:hypothetical protein
MHGFINSPALAQLVALQMVDEEHQKNQRRRKAHTSFRTRLAVRRSARAAAPAAPAAPAAKGQRRNAKASLVEESR